MLCSLLLPSHVCGGSCCACPPCLQMPRMVGNPDRHFPVLCCTGPWRAGLQTHEDVTQAGHLCSSCGSMEEPVGLIEAWVGPGSSEQTSGARRTHPLGQCCLVGPADADIPDPKAPVPRMEALCPEHCLSGILSLSGFTTEQIRGESGLRREVATLPLSTLWVPRAHLTGSPLPLWC